MGMSVRAVVKGVGRAVPPKILTNEDLEKLVETSDEWIVQRTGIKERHICAVDETSATLSATAGRLALDSAGMEASELDLVICATVTGDMAFPSTSSLIQSALKAKNAGAMDLGAACAGFIYAVEVASCMIKTGSVRNVLVVGVDTLSKWVDWTDRSTCVLFGDGAGAVILSAEENSERGVLGTVLMADGDGSMSIHVEAGGSRYPLSGEEWKTHGKSIVMAGAEVYRFAVIAMGEACTRLMKKLDMTIDDIDLFVPHQANLRIIDSAARRLGLPPEKVFINVHKYGNTSGGSVPIALAEAQETGVLKPGMRVMTVGFGAGLVWGSNLISW